MNFPNSKNIGGAGVKRLTKISIVFVLISIFTTAYAFAAFIGNHSQPLPDPLYLLILGVMLLCASHFINLTVKK